MTRRLLAALLFLPMLLVGCSSTPTTTTSTSGATTTTAAAATPTCPPVAGATTRTTTFAAPPPMCLETGKTYAAVVKTDIGTIEITFDASAAPKTVNNFVFLARNHYYDGIVFHRVISGFMAQTGDPTGTGRGGPGYKFTDELPKAGSYKVGSVAMANAGANTNGSQFFLITGDAGVALAPSYSLFGQVTSGMDVLMKIDADGGDPQANGMPPKVTHTMQTVTIVQR